MAMSEFLQTAGGILALLLAFLALVGVVVAVLSVVTPLFFGLVRRIPGCAWLADHHSARVGLLTLYAIFWSWATWGGWHEYQSSQQLAGEAATYWGYYRSLWSQLTFENLASEVFQIWLALEVFTHLRAKGAPEDREEQSRLERKVDETQFQVSLVRQDMEQLRRIIASLPKPDTKGIEQRLQSHSEVHGLMAQKLDALEDQVSATRASVATLVTKHSGKDALAALWNEMVSGLQRIETKVTDLAPTPIDPIPPAPPADVSPPLDTEPMPPRLDQDEPINPVVTEPPQVAQKPKRSGRIVNVPTTAELVQKLPGKGRTKGGTA